MLFTAMMNIALSIFTKIITLAVIKDDKKTASQIIDNATIKIFIISFISIPPVFFHSK